MSLKKDDQINIRCNYLYKIKGITDVKLTFLKTVGIKTVSYTLTASERTLRNTAESSGRLSRN